jgi:ubiquinone/menaquinone biosynthesis C-methylase UbiE
MTSSKTYTLPVGTEDEKRLQALNHICNPHTLNFLDQNLPDLTNKVVVDVGCGIGMMTVELAKRVGPQGKVIAVDISEEQLTLAKAYAHIHQLTNIEFVCQSADSLEQIKVKADLVYTRFLLEHVQNPIHILKQMYGLLKPGGYLFCENLLSYESMFCVPETDIYHDWQRVILLQPELHHTDFFIGKKLYHYFQEIGFQPTSYQIQQPFISDIEDRIQFHLVTQSKTMQNLLVEKRHYTKDKLLDITSKVIDLMRGDVLVTFPQYIQILGQKT